MFLKDPVLQENRYCVVTSRASTGIYLILRTHCRVGEKILVPANLCYAGIFPAVYVGMEILFCDVDKEYGNVTFETFKNAYTCGVKAAIVPHMYGQPVKDMEAIAEFCREHDILLIEDCASAMRARADYPLGRMGDYTVYSMGYSKTVELGYGGLICSDRPMTEIEEIEQNLPSITEIDEENLVFFSKLYRLIRNQGNGTQLEKAIYRTLPDLLRNGFIHRISQEQKNWLYNQLSSERIDGIIKKRWEVYSQYKDELSDCCIRLYPYDIGAVPWRFSIFMEEDERKRIIDRMLRERLPVSDWYPRVTPIFLDDGKYPGAEWHEKHIINFPVSDSETMHRICALLRAEEV